jgi:hypothetical protein
VLNTDLLPTIEWRGHQQDSILLGEGAGTQREWRIAPAAFLVLAPCSCSSILSRAKSHIRTATGKGDDMGEAVNAALKEWAVVCRALADGRQTLLIRKGGIQEVKGGFEVTHQRFWLFPTYVHQKEADLVPAAREEFRTVQATLPTPGTLAIQLYATVADVVRVGDLESLQRLADQHILSRECVGSRFHYRNKPGVHVLTLRVFLRPAPIRLEQKSWYDGCVSWVELDQAINPDGCEPVLSDSVFEARCADIRAKLRGSGSRA